MGCPGIRACDIGDLVLVFFQWQPWRGGQVLRDKGKETREGGHLQCRLRAASLDLIFKFSAPCYDRDARRVPRGAPGVALYLGVSQECP